ncbi:MULTISPECIES: DUF5304 domain-containing protein [Streptomyces]|uniref:DUF5304 domain-containing protein n=1 Tax=Streptomyces lichenis TaxID=2306967 RepID=A0ABT0IEJ0_9ACTN|nr:DUF5304 domain-containing protein [Streptomyces lichenis]MCK8679682.1 DUF5304 domain-containing protein [Streptomyces lichenis]
MSDATERPDADAWAQACAEDLASEKARRRGTSPPPPGAAADELRKLVDAVADKVASLRTPLLGAGAQSALRQFADQAKAAVEPVIERNPRVFDHLAAAGSELLAAYRSAVEGQEGRWTAGPSTGRPDRDTDPGPARPGDRGPGPVRRGEDGPGPVRRDDDGPEPGEPIDLD